MTLRKAIIWSLIVGAVAVFAGYVSTRPMDFRVYHYGARGVFEGTRPVYGAASGLGWPLHYRYPPLFLLLVGPLAWLPLGTAAAIWLVLKAASLILLLRSMARQLPLSPGISGWLVPVLLAGPYIVEDFRYGNAQFLVFALTSFGLLRTRERPVLASAALALAAAVKVWPLFFVPYLLVRGERRAVAGILLLTIVFSMAPAAYFGVGGNFGLLRQWFDQEFATQTGRDEIWFPSQSLRGVMMRYFTLVDYSQVPDSNYPLVHVATWDPHTVRNLWLTLAGLAYLGFLRLAYLQRTGNGWTNVALGYCLIGLLQPFTQKYALVLLLWPALVAAGWTRERWCRLFIGASLVLVLVQPIAPGSAAQRRLQVLGLDFVATASLALALTLASLQSWPAGAGGRRPVSFR